MIVTAIYSTTPASNRGLRDCPRELIKKHKGSLRSNDAFTSPLRHDFLEGDFVLDVIDAGDP